MTDLESVYLQAKRSSDAMKITQQLIDADAIFRALPLSIKIGPEGVNQLIDGAVVCPTDRMTKSSDLLVSGELRLVAGKPVSAEEAIRAAIQKGNAKPFFFKSLGWCLLAQGKIEEARTAFHEALKTLRSENGTYDLEKADPDQMTAAYFLDVVNDQAYTEHFGNDERLACFPWFYVAQRRDIEGKKDAAIEAYERCVELGTGDNPHTVRALAEWRLRKLKESPTPGHK